MEVSGCESFLRYLNLLRAALEKRECGVRRFFHHIAQLSGEFDFLLQDTKPLLYRECLRPQGSMQGRPQVLVFRDVFYVAVEAIPAQHFFDVLFANGQLLFVAGRLILCALLESCESICVRSLRSFRLRERTPASRVCAVITSNT